MYKNSCVWVHRTDVRQQPSVSRQKAEIHKQKLNKTWRWWPAMAPHPIPLPCALAFPPPIHWHATTPSPCWAPHSITQERIMFSNPAPSEPRLSPAATMSDDTLSALTPPLHCASILQPTTPPQVVALDHLCSNLSQSFHFCWIMEIWSLNLCVCSYLFLVCLCFSYRNSLQLEVPVCNLVVITAAIPLLLLP